MNREEFIIFIISLGFEYNGFCYRYKNYIIYLYQDHYDLFNGYIDGSIIKLNDLSPLEKYFKNELRSIKLKKILG